MDERKPPPGSSQAPAAAPAPLATALSMLVPLGIVLAFVLLVVGAATAVVRWWLFDEAGSQWLVQRLPLVQVEGFRGTLLGPRWQARRLQLALNGGELKLDVQDLDLSGLRWHWRPNEHALVGLEIESFGARKVSLDTGKPAPRPLPLPSSLGTPLQLTARQGRIGELEVDALPALQRVAVQSLVLDATPGASHRVEGLQADWYGVSSEVDASIGSTAPFLVALQAGLRPSAGGDTPAWGSTVQLAGPLAELELTGTLRGVPRGQRAAPSVDVRAGLRPLLAWPLASLQLQTRELDLAAIGSWAPQTRLSGQVTLVEHALGKPLTARVELDNALPGRWNEGRLPLRRLSADIRGDPLRPERLDAQAFELVLADGALGAGRIAGQLAWSGDALRVDAQVHDLMPQSLDGRAAAMTVSGPVQFSLLGLPAPDGKGAKEAPSVQWQVDLQGLLDAAPQPVRLAMSGSANDRRLQIGSLQASSGKATAALKLSLQRSGKGQWQLDTSGSLVDFDPLPWWRGDAGSALRKGVHRLSADWELDVRVPENAAALPTLELAQRLAGNGRLRLHDSQLAGVALAGEVRMSYTPGPAAAPARLDAELTLGGNRVDLEGRGDPTGSGGSDRWRLELHADHLAALEPLAGLHPGLADWVPREGTASATVVAGGRWPDMQSVGTSHLSQLKMGTLAVAEGRIDWRVETGLESPLSMKLALAGLTLGHQRADHLRVSVTGTPADHRISMAGALPVRPPEAAMKLVGALAQSGTRVQMQAQGNWTVDAAGGGLWRARVEELLAGSWDGAIDDSPPASVWARARDLDAEVRFDRAGQVVALQARPGTVLFAGDLALRWDEVKVDLRGAQPQVALHAEIAPFALAPLLARLQPGMGWSGDLRVTAHVDVRAAERFDADLVIERSDGDLHIESGNAMQLLGLTELRLGASAHDGNWTFTPAFKGRSLGEISGSVRVATTPERRWPHAEAALQGDVQARVANIGIWGAWVPPGWRLGGELLTIANLSGTFGAPRYVGALTANGVSARNLLQGVNVSEGQLAVRLEGDRATIGLFTLRGGDGKLTVTGDASLGASPSAKMHIKADRFRAMGRVDRMAIVSGQADLSLSGQQVRLDGAIKLDEGLFDAGQRDAPSLDSDVTVRAPGEVAEAVDEGARPAASHVFSLALDIDLGHKMLVRGRGIDTGLTGGVRVRHQGGRLDVRGTINTESGTYAAYGQKLVLERGVVAFGGPVDDPRLDILALRPNIDQRVGVAISGTLLTPRVRLYADPDMSDTEKLSWLVLGRAPEGLGRNDTALLQRAAVALLAGEGEAPTDTLLKNLGIDDISLRQGEGDVRETVFSLGKQLSRRWYLGYERGVNSATGTWQLIYRIAQRFTVRAQSGLENSLDVIWSWRVQETPPDAAMRKSTAVPP